MTDFRALDLNYLLMMILLGAWAHNVEKCLTFDRDLGILDFVVQRNILEVQANQEEERGVMGVP